MNSLFITLTLLLGFSAHASPRPTTVDTLITCQQEDGDQWVEIGIALNDGPGLRAYVVAHNSDDGSAKLIENRQVSVSKKNGKTVYQDSLQTLRLTVSKKSGDLVGNLIVLQDGPGGLKQNGLLCYKNSSIQFD